MAESGLNTHRDAMVRAPRRPIYMITISTNFAVGSRFGVIPVESPTVPNADVTSNKTSINGRWGSMMQTRKLPTATTHAERVVTMAAL